MQTNFSVSGQYGEDLTAKQYITNPAIAREEDPILITRYPAIALGTCPR